MIIGVVSVFGSLLIGFGIAGTSVTIKTEETLLSPNPSYLARSQNALFVNIEGQTLYTDKYEMVIAPLENIRVNKIVDFNSYNNIIKSTYSFVIIRPK